jgi:PAS domain S-box-containing protein
MVISTHTSPGALAAPRNGAGARRLNVEVPLDPAVLCAAFHSSGLGAALVDDEDHFIAVNGSFCKMFGRSEAELFEMTVAQLTRTSDLPVSRRFSAAVMSGALPFAYFEKRVIHSAGTDVWVRVHMSPVTAPHGERYRLMQTVDITHQKDAEALAERTSDRLRSTLMVQRDITAASRDRQTTLQVVADRAVEVFAVADGAVVELIDGLDGTGEAHDELRYVAVAGTLGPFADVRMKQAGSLSELAIRLGETMRCDDPDADPRVDRATCQRLGIRSMIVAPLFSKDRTIGVLKISSRYTWAFDDSDVQQLQLLAGSVSSALRHADDFASLEAANQLKLDLIGMLGHEIGTPLTSIMSYAETAHDDWRTLPPERRAAVLEVISRNAHRLNSLVGDVLSMVTIDSGELRVNREAINLAEAITTALAAAGAETVPVNCPADLGVQIQPGHLEQILVNFLTNAAKYAGNAAAVNAYRDGERVRIDVVDDGPGVPESFRSKLFDRFARAEGAVVNGTGLGLYIVRILARANAGDADYRPNPSGGSIFSVELEPGPAS